MTYVGWVIVLYLVLIIATLITVNHVLRKDKDDNEWRDGTKGE